MIYIYIYIKLLPNIIFPSIAYNLFQFYNREILSAVESTTTQSLRVTLTRQLAEVLLRGISGTDYKPPDEQTDTMSMITNICPHKYSGIFRRRKIHSY